VASVWLRSGTFLQDTQDTPPAKFTFAVHVMSRRWRSVNTQYSRSFGREDGYLLVGVGGGARMRESAKIEGKMGCDICTSKYVLRQAASFITF